MFQLRCVTLGAILMGGAAFAQPGRHGMGMPPGGPGDFAFVRGEFGMAGKVVTGAPYSAQAVTQFTQTLADGNHIQRSTAASLARDSQGRTRTERSMAAIGALAGSGTASKAVFINDPVAGTGYMLDATHKTARQMPANRHRPPSDPSLLPGTGTQAHVFSEQRSNANVKIDDLGTQVMDGLSVQGKRKTKTILAAQAGSARDIEVVTETWYSPDLQMVVMSKTSDPRFGDSLYQVTNISRAEPDPSLFAVPSDYQVQQGRLGGPVQ
ncbi:MAG TPA: hypothetical protein VNV82_17130 [Bryobacteraceae bacterium]|jgi:hypothetical protein|nr:hypothetical protein [Bryobacteraceae bacterium]